ncbi:FkbM family methyltransferase [Phototrophicus methaneseepsis]|uniref:FkbM family methyltransferase n=1 Tax=Phototrophicus methaneseepsis TaxID=2710758 RepID=A0A7S8IE43_9CHLR|nr:FkbM family methyltransferase [Phototrophicus methaneseepsis]QPC82034.1 FkbM family methyltransferase [Phototrophicus methaneseepsis]
MKEKTRLQKLGRRLTYSLIPHHPLLFRFARRYVDDYLAQNNADMHTNGEVLFLERLLPQFDETCVVFDVGANVGSWSKQVLLVKPNASIYAFEPSSYTFSELKKNNFPSNVHLNHLGLGKAESELKLQIYGDGHGQNSLHDLYGKPSVSEETVHISTITKYVHECSMDYIDLLKIDTEGHELFVLQGADSLLKEKRIKTIQFEYGAQYSSAGVLLADVDRYLREYGYDIYKLAYNGLMPIKSYDPIHEMYQNSNFIAMLPAYSSAMASYIKA